MWLSYAFPPCYVLALAANALMRIQASTPFPYARWVLYWWVLFAPKMFTPPSIGSQSQRRSWGSGESPWSSSDHGCFTIIATKYFRTSDQHCHSPIYAGQKRDPRHDGSGGQIAATSSRPLLPTPSLDVCVDRLSGRAGGSLERQSINPISWSLLIDSASTLFRFLVKRRHDRSRTSSSLTRLQRWCSVQDNSLVLEP